MKLDFNEYSVEIEHNISHRTKEKKTQIYGIHLMKHAFNYKFKCQINRYTAQETEVERMCASERGCKALLFNIAALLPHSTLPMAQNVDSKRQRFTKQNINAYDKFMFPFDE